MRGRLLAATALALLALGSAAVAQRPGETGLPGGSWGGGPGYPPGMMPPGRPPAWVPRPPGPQAGAPLIMVPPEAFLPQPEMVGPAPPAPSQPMFTDGWTRDGFGASR